MSKKNYLDVLGRGKDKFLHPKDLSSFLFQYEISRKSEGSEIFADKNARYYTRHNLTDENDD